MNICPVQLVSCGTGEKARSGYKGQKNRPTRALMEKGLGRVCFTGDETIKRDVDRQYPVADGKEPMSRAIKLPLD
ncbi:hypothetical protein L248_2224 [Schleiferilactobacillus shenzhenensis LY-73]|uniref:Uncharacterized protein n=1 Tax=Schleiferilactobacillus shenzhenensis LY-73 TaxID=1231336 RepID=U4TK57_9LACO|nr:hypothetical protein L248_2224 [Schleiferilactobacillus shenzhenensis LY-73]